jgi:hypothetical protein
MFAATEAAPLIEIKAVREKSLCTRHYFVEEGELGHPQRSCGPRDVRGWAS